jgi:sulfur carrier protein ThiS
VGLVRKYVQDRCIDVPVDETTDNILRLLNIPLCVRPLALVNNRRSRPDQRLQEGDVITIVSTIMGG